MINYIKNDNAKLKNYLMKNKFSKCFFFNVEEIGYSIIFGGGPSSGP
jgi:hypothetical protein